jgi:hypothetical protein
MEQYVVWLCLVILPMRSCILEKRSFQRPVSVGIFATSTCQHLGKRDGSTAPGGSSALYSVLQQH